MLEVRRRLSASKCWMYDPVLTPLEVEVLASLGVDMIPDNEEGKRLVTKPTVFIMPHCPMQLYNNVVWANWGKPLANVVVVGNSFQSYDDNVGGAARTTKLACLLQALPLVHEVPLPAPDNLFMAFNNTR